MQLQEDNFALGLNLILFHVVLRDTTERELLLWKNEVLIHQSFQKNETELVQTHTPLLFLVWFFSWNREWHHELTLRSFRCRTGDFHPSHSATHLAFMLLSPIKAELYLLLFPWVFWLQVSTACMHMRGRSGMGKVLFYQLECFFFPVAWLTKLLSLKSWPGRGSEWGLMQLPCLKKLGLEAAEREVC